MGFSERLWQACGLAGIWTPAELARCWDKSLGYVLEMVQTEGASVLAQDFLRLAAMLHVRAHWLMFGTGGMLPWQDMKGRESEVLEILAGMPPDRASNWLDLGRYMLPKRR